MRYRFYATNETRINFSPLVEAPTVFEASCRFFLKYGRNSCIKKVKIDNSLKEYRFHFSLSGLDSRGNPIENTTSVYTQTVTASTVEIAEKRLRDFYHKTVVLTIMEAWGNSGMGYDRIG